MHSNSLNCSVAVPELTEGKLLNLLTIKIFSVNFFSVLLQLCCWFPNIWN